jgi:hypothetical protein
MMKQTIKQILGNNYFLIFVVVSFPALFIFQCGDLTDTGFFANEYFFFHDNIASNSIRSTIFLTSLLGNICFDLTPFQELISLKFLFLIFTYILVFISYLLVKPFQLPKWLMHLSILCGLFFATRVTNFIFEYDIASYTMLIAAVYFTATGFKENKQIHFFVAGIFIGLATLFRFPSVAALFPFSIIILFNNFQLSNSLKNLKLLNWRITSFLLFGFITLLGISLLVLMSLHLDEAFLNGFSAVSKSIGGQDSTSHGLYKLLYKYLSDVIKFLPHLTVGLILLFITRSVLKNIYSTVTFTFLLAVFIFFTYDLDTLHNYESNIKFLPLILFAFILITSRDTWKSTSILLIFSVLLTQVAGSNTGLFLKMSYGMIAFIPVLIGHLHNSENKWLSRPNIALFSAIQLILIASFSLMIRWAWIYHVDDSFSARFQMKSPLKHEKLIGIYTNPNRAQEINNAIQILNDGYLLNKDLLITNNDVLYYYLTNKLPITSDFWLSNYSSHLDILSDIKRNKKNNTLVVIEDTYRDRNQLVDSLINDLKGTFQFTTIYKSSKYTISELPY